MFFRLRGLGTIQHLTFNIQQNPFANDLGARIHGVSPPFSSASPGVGVSRASWLRSPVSCLPSSSDDEVCPSLLILIVLSFDMDASALRRLSVPFFTATSSTASSTSCD